MSFKHPTLFRSLSAYRITQAIPLFHDLKALNEALAVRPEHQPALSALSSTGFRPTLATRQYEKANLNQDPDSPLDEDDRQFANAPDGRPSNLIHLELVTWERQVPSWEVRRRLAQKVEKIELNEQRKIYKKERDQLKDDVVQEILATALVKPTFLQALILPSDHLILVDTPSAKKAEMLLSMLREALGSLPVRQLKVRLEPSVSMTEWLRDKRAPYGFSLLDGVIMEDDHSGKVGMVHQDITDDVVDEHLSHGLMATKLAIAYGNMSFLLEQSTSASAFLIRKIHHADLVADQFYANNGDSCDPITEHNGLHLLQAASLRSMLTDLVEALGGEDEPKQI